MLWFLLLCLTAHPVVASTDLPRGRLVESFATSSSPYTKGVKVGGSLDETRFLWPNLPATKRFHSRFRIANEGDQEIVNPRLTINGFRIPLTSDELIEELTHNSRNPLDKVLRTYYAMCYFSVHAEPHIETGEPLSYFLYHSYGICNQQGAVQASLWELYGYKWRDSGPHNHWSAEVEVQGKTVHLDTDMDAYYLMYDNHTIASAQNIHDDPMLVLRASHSRVYDRFPRMAEDPEVNMYFSSEKIAALYWARPSIPSLALGKPVKESIRLVLRPGESYGWHTGERRTVHPNNSDPSITTVARDVFWETHLDLANKSHRWFLNDKKQGGKTRTDRSVDLKGAIITLPYRLPFPALEMSIRLIPASADDADGPATDEKVRIRLVTNGKTLEESVALNEIIKDAYSFDRLVKEMPFPLTEFRVEIDGSKALLNSRREFLLSGIRINLNCLGSIFALRALKTGANTLVYSDASSRRFVRIEAEAHQEEILLPRLPDGRYYPQKNAEIPESRLRFVWPEAVDDAAAGYQFQISAFPDMRYPLSPTFDRLVNKDQMRTSGGTVAFRLPWQGMLPVQKQLYWRVRPFSRAFLAGDWSKTFAFRVRGPGAPEQISVTEKDGKVVLSWKAAAYGSTPARYEIHTSNLEGFIPVDKPHRILGLSDTDTNKRCWEDTCATAWPIVPSTFFATASETKLDLLPSDKKNLNRTLGAHWRVIAVDAEGSRSAPSPQGFLRTPMLIPPETIVVPPGRVTYRVPFVSTLGRVWIKHSYDMGLWSKPKLAFSLMPNPSAKVSGWKIDKTRGIITGHLETKGEIALFISIQDQFGRADTRAIRFQTKAK